MPRNKYEIGSDIAGHTPQSSLRDSVCVFCYSNNNNKLIKDLVALCSPCHKKFLLVVELQSI